MVRHESINKKICCKISFVFESGMRLNQFDSARCATSLSHHLLLIVSVGWKWHSYCINVRNVILVTCITQFDRLRTNWRNSSVLSLSNLSNFNFRILATVKLNNFLIYVVFREFSSSIFLKNKVAVEKILHQIFRSSILHYLMAQSVNITSQLLFIFTPVVFYFHAIIPVGLTFRDCYCYKILYNIDHLFWKGRLSFLF